MLCNLSVLIDQVVSEPSTCISWYMYCIIVPIDS